MSAQAVQSTGFWNSYPGTFVKSVSIAATASLVDFRLQGKYVYPFCDSSSGGLSDYLCLRVGKLFNLHHVSIFNAPLSKLRSLIANTVAPIIPDLGIHPKNCQEFSDLSHKVLTSATARSRHSLKELLEIKSALNLDLLNCCLTEGGIRTSAYIISNALAEELIFRVGIQKIALLSLAKLFPDRIRNILQNAPTRIFITSLIFAAIHVEIDPQTNLLPHFLVSLLFGTLYETHGLVAAATAHSVSNILPLLEIKDACEKGLSSKIEHMRTKFTN